MHIELNGGFAAAQRLLRFVIFANTLKNLVTVSLVAKMSDVGDQYHGLSHELLLRAIKELRGKKMRKFEGCFEGSGTRGHLGVPAFRRGFAAAVLHPKPEHLPAQMHAIRPLSAHLSTLHRVTVMITYEYDRYSRPHGLNQYPGPTSIPATANGYIRILGTVF
jgi:hypothetical protein